MVVNGESSPRRARKSHPLDYGVLLYSSLKADLHLQTRVTRYHGFTRRRRVAHAYCARVRVRAYGPLKRHQRRRTCGTPRRRLMHFYGG